MTAAPVPAVMSTITGERGRRERQRPGQSHNEIGFTQHSNRSHPSRLRRRSPFKLNAPQPLRFRRMPKCRIGLYRGVEGNDA
jgi:hypothetical protein